MSRKNSTRRVPQRLKHNIEDRIARREVAKIVEQSYREEARSVRYEPTGDVVLTFTDPSYGLARG